MTFQSKALPKPPKRPCGSCPYRKDIPSGVWSEVEYDKLKKYDGETWQQSPSLFMCHQRDGCVCGGWLQTHDTDHLLALRINPVDEACFGYQSDIPTFETGTEAAEHGKAEIDCPGDEAQAIIHKVGNLIKSKVR